MIDNIFKEYDRISFKILHDEEITSYEIVFMYFISNLFDFYKNFKES